MGEETDFQHHPFRYNAPLEEYLHLQELGTVLCLNILRYDGVLYWPVYFFSQGHLVKFLIYIISVCDLQTVNSNGVAFMMLNLIFNLASVGQCLRELLLLIGIIMWRNLHSGQLCLCIIHTGIIQWRKSQIWL